MYGIQYNIMMGSIRKYEFGPSVDIFYGYLHEWIRVLQRFGALYDYKQFHL